MASDFSKKSSAISPLLWLSAAAGEIGKYLISCAELSPLTVPVGKMKLGTGSFTIMVESGGVVVRIDSVFFYTQTSASGTPVLTNLGCVCGHSNLSGGRTLSSADSYSISAK